MRRLLLLLVITMTACSLDPFIDPTVPTDDELAELDALAAVPLLLDAADRYGVPDDLVLSIAWKRTSFVDSTTHEHAEEDAHGPTTYGLLGLGGDQLPVAAAASGMVLGQVEDSRAGATLAAVAYLATLRDSLSPAADPATPDAGWWAPVVAFGGHDEQWMDHELAFEVFRTLQEGLAAADDLGEPLVIPRRSIEGLADVPYVRQPGIRDESFSSSADYPGADAWLPAHSGNQSSREGVAPERIVLHTTEGSYSGAISWFRNNSSDVSAHYVVRRSDGHVTQMVRDAGKAWHACQNNSDTIGIEHEGQSSNSAQWTPALLESSAQLTAWLVQEHNIPLDRDHIVGHGEIQPSSCAGRVDPGPHFPWDAYMARVGEIVNGAVAQGGPVAFAVPRDGETVGDPVAVRVLAHETHHVDLWAGPQLVASGLSGSPLHTGWTSNASGPRTLTAKGYDPAGVLVSEASVAFVVTPADPISVGAAPLSGATWRLSANTGVSPASIRYLLDGSVLAEVSSGFGFAVDVDMPQAGGTHLLQARAFDNSGAVLAEGSRVLDITPTPQGQGAILSWAAQSLGDGLIRFTAAATSEVQVVEYWANQFRLIEPSSGDDAGSPPSFTFDFPFMFPGPRAIELRAYDGAGDLVDVASGTIVVPSDTLTVSWSQLSDGAYRFTAQVPTDTATVTYAVDGFDLADRTTGATSGTGADFRLDYAFTWSGVRQLTAEARDSNGSLLDTFSSALPVLGIEDGGGEPPPPNVITVSSLPFSGTGNTSLSPASLLNSYSCAPVINEAGPEITYIVDVPSDGTLTATISDGTGVDVDVHILSALDAGSCLARGHTQASASVSAGTAYVIVDSWTPSSGNPLSGPYSISIAHTPTATGTGCPSDRVCVDTFPFSHSSSTTGGLDAFDAYSCAWGVDESGPERIYEVELPQAGLLSATVLDGSGVDVDVHILDSLDPSDCLDRGNYAASAELDAGTAFVIVDSWVTSGGTSLNGPYTLDLQLLPSSAGSGGGSSSSGTGCPAGQVCVESLPFAENNSTIGGSSMFDAYSCNWGVDESGPERIYRVTVPGSGLLSAGVSDGYGVDVDVHILGSLSASDCLSRGNHTASAVVSGTVYVVVDSWVNAAGTALSGDYTLSITF